MIALDPAPMGRVYALVMRRTGLYISELAKRGGTTRKALRLYESAGILPASRRTAAGYRIYDGEALEVLSFIRRARGLGFTLAEIKDIVAIGRAGRAPCPHVRQHIRHKLEDLEAVRKPPAQLVERLAHGLARPRRDLPPYRTGEPTKGRIKR